MKLKYEMKGFKLHRTIAKVVLEAPDQYARILADEMGLTGEERYLFIAKVEQTTNVEKILIVIGAMTVAATPYVMLKALTR